MQELNIKNSEKMKVFIDELPDFSKIPLSELNLFISELELEISQLVDKSCKRKKYYQQNKQKITNIDNVRPP